MKCLECGHEFSEELSEMSLSELRDSQYDPKMISDAKDRGFCSKWCEKKHDDTSLETGRPVLGIAVGSVEKSKRLKKTGGYDTRDVKESPLGVMERDKAMVRMIKDNKAGDPGLKRQAEAITREYENQRKERNRVRDQRELKDIRQKAGLLRDPRLRRQYGYS